MISVFVCFSKVDLPKANGFLPPTNCGEYVHGGMQPAKPLLLLNTKSPLVAAMFSPLLSFFSYFLAAAELLRHKSNLLAL